MLREHEWEDRVSALAWMRALMLRVRSIVDPRYTTKRLIFRAAMRCLKSGSWLKAQAKSPVLVEMGTPVKSPLQKKHRGDEGADEVVTITPVH